MSELRFGILGAAKIAPAALVVPCARSNAARVVAVAARDPKRAEQFAAEHDIPEVSASYADLVARDDIDCVYNPLPPSQHAPWSIAALEAGKHVLCEKPFCLDVGEAEQMVATARRSGLVLCEAYHDRYHPLATRICEIVASGSLGELRHIEGRFTVPIPDTTDLRYQPELGGGSTMDLGCYPIHQALMVAGSTPEVVSAQAVEGPPGIDVEMTAVLSFPGGATARIHCGMSAGIEVALSLEVVGSAGKLSVRNPIHPYAGHELQLETESGSETSSVDGDTTYAHQLEAFCSSVRDGTPLATGGRDAIETMRVIEAVYAKAGLPPRGGAPGNDQGRTSKRSSR